MTTLRNSVGERIRAIRKAKGLTQQQLAELSGLDDAYIGSVERGERNFSIDTLEKIVHALGMPLANFFAINNQKEDDRQFIIDKVTTSLHQFDVNQIEIIDKIAKELIKLFHKH
ncbi:helix-turn-helix transcriptional regulator [Paenibacillus sp. FSL H7-0942]|uniref:helix-turn-helix domain-containing protein n=1 Tax=Paenibacillus TaxID=44249 RepID=UPI00096DB21E|nr:helix-turn-helix transcriptional regulator [Paenibacillus amylolyticus]OMF02793.1 transcriptional regulator [Paenibacillus amylolyticus]